MGGHAEHDVEPFYGDYHEFDVDLPAKTSVTPEEEADCRAGIRECARCRWLKKRGYLTDWAVRSALDALWTKTLRFYDLLMSRRMRHCPVYPVYGPPVPFGVPELDWTVSIPGWRLVIEGGAIRGLEETR